MNVIEMTNIKKRAGQFLLDIPHLEIQEGFITGFVGQNGAGKTTTLKLIMDLIRPDQGDIKVFGKSVTKHSEEIRSKIGFVGDPTGFTEELRVDDMKRIIKQFYSNWDESLYNKYMKRFDLSEKMVIKELSQGQNKQLAMAMTLARRPKLILLDEPTANLDPIIRNYILDVLMDHMQDEETSVFYSTHITTDLDKASDYIVYIKGGKVVFNKDKETLNDNYFIIKGNSRLLMPETEKVLIGCKKRKETFEALTPNYQKAFACFGNDVVYEKATVEDIMVAYERER